MINVKFCGRPKNVAGCNGTTCQYQHEWFNFTDDAWRLYNQGARMETLDYEIQPNVVRVTVRKEV